MKFYLDLEANAITNEVISIGIVTESGDEFYSLVRPHTKLDHNIKILTGISQTEADEVPSLEDVMSSVGEFLGDAKDGIFYHYGSGDRQFLKASMSFTKDIKALTVLEDIHDRCENVDKRVASHFHRDTIGLRSVYLTMKMSSEESATQNHNALEDALMLKYVWENIDDYTLPEGVEPVKVKRINMKYGKGKKKKQQQQKISENIPKLPTDRLTGNCSGSRHKQAAGIIPAIDDEKYQIKIRARKKKKSHRLNSEYESIYSAIGLTKQGKFKTAQEIFDAIESIYNALDTENKVNGWIFERVEK